MEGIGYAAEEFPLRFREFKIVRESTVQHFSGVSADDHHSHIIGLCLGGETGFRKLWLRNLAALEAQNSQSHGVSGKSQRPGGFLVLFILVIVVFQIFIYKETVLFQRLVHRHHICFVHIAGTGSASHEIHGRHAEQGYFCTFGKRQGLLIPEHHDGLTGHPAGYGRIGLEVRIVGILVSAEGIGFHHKFQNAAGIAVYFIHRNAAILYGSEDAVHLFLFTRFHQVCPCLHGLHGTVLHPPVGHHKSLKAPLVAEDGGQELIVLLRVRAVEPVIGSHHSPRLRLLHCNLEILQVDFPQGTLAHAGFALESVRFLIVGSKMFHRSAHAFVLEAHHIGYTHFSGEDGIF